METKKYLEKFYEECDEDGRLTSKHGWVEYATTMTFLQKYLRPGMRVLEIGAGTGRYSHALAQQGYMVDAVELLEHNIELFRQHTQPGERVTIAQGNAVDLSGFASGTYDVIPCCWGVAGIIRRQHKPGAPPQKRRQRAV